jgi:hypothetical protein
MSAFVRFRRVDEAPTDFSIEAVEEGGKVELNDILARWSLECDEILRAHPTLSARDTEIVLTAKKVYDFIIGFLKCPYSKETPFYVAKSEGRVFSVAVLDECTEIISLDPRVLGDCIDILALVSDPNNLPISIHPCRIKGAGSSLIHKVMDVVCEGSYVGIVTDSYDSSVGFYAKFGFINVEKEETEEEGQHMMLLKEHFSGVRKKSA